MWPRQAGATLIGIVTFWSGYQGNGVAANGGPISAVEQSKFGKVFDFKDVKISNFAR